MSFVAYAAGSQEPLTLDDVKMHCRIDGADEDAFILQAIIPAARALAEQKSGCAIRMATYSDTIPSTGILPLSMGGVTAIQSVQLNGSAVTYTAQIDARRTYVIAPAGAVVTYTAGINIEHHPGVKSWMLLACAWLYANRELIGAKEMEPPYATEFLLSSISVPAGF